MRIGFAWGAWGSGGIASNVVRLSEEFIRRGHSVTYFLFDASGGRKLLAPHGVEVHEGRGRARNSLSAASRYLSRVRPDVIIGAHTHVRSVIEVACRWSDRRPILLWNFHTDVLRNISGKSPVHRWYLGLLGRHIGRFLFRRTDILVAVSRGVAESAADWYRLPKNAIQTIYNPVWSPQLARSAEEPAAHPWLDDSANSPRVVLAVGRLTEQKDYPTLLEAFFILSKSQPAKLIVLGEGPDRAELGQRVRHMDLEDRVAFLGHVSNPFAFMSRADLLVLSSAWEGFGNVLVEAMSVGTPVVSTRCPSGPEEILDGGRYGPLVNVGEPSALANAMQEVLHEPPPSASLIARAKDFSVEAIAEKYLDTIQEKLSVGERTRCPDSAS